MASVTELNVNGTKHRVEVDASESLLNVLRDQLGLCGAKYGCGEGRCGACTVVVDGRATRSCVTPVGNVQNRPITTIESLADGDKLHPLQQAFLDCGAMQCGYCTPGMIMSALVLLKENGDPQQADILRYMEGNICRCGTYARIESAIHQAAKAMQGGVQ